jgi:chorismate mutase/prephenate dehydratase
MSKEDLHTGSKELPTLSDVRRQIDDIDHRIHQLLNDRARAALSVATIKLAEAQGEAVDFYRPEREAQILKDVADRNEGPMEDRAVQRIFREIISASLALEAPMRVAYLGPEGTYTHAAADRHFGHAVETVSEPDIPDIFHSVEAGHVRFGVVPVENSIEGAVNQTLDQLTRTSLSVCGEVRMRIQHCLLSKVDALDQINANLPDAERISASSNAAAAKTVLDKPGTAAIAGETAARLYDLSVLASGIEDEKNNTTRFLVIGNQQIPPSGDDSTLLLIAAPHRPGGLRGMLEPLEKAGVSMTRIESRPSRSGLWDYVFFIDVNGHAQDPNLSDVLQELRESAPLLKVLGSYPRAL